MTLCYGIQNVLIIILYYIRSARPVVPDYCLQPLNKNDCGLKPTAVMTYWKPGSRCEIEVWRGCPTANKFQDEYNCSATCIFQAHMETDHKDECKEVMNAEKCADFEQEVYTYKDGQCVPTIWRGCPTLNKFINSTVCNNRCAPDQWIGTLEQMNITDLEICNAILDEFLDDSLEKIESKQKASEEDSEKKPDSGSDEIETLDDEVQSTDGGPAEAVTTEASATDAESKEAEPTESSTPDDEPATAEPTKAAETQESPTTETEPSELPATEAENAKDAPKSEEGVVTV